MKKILKIIGWTFLTILVIGIGFGIYFYQSNPMFKAIANNDESKLYYFPTKEMDSMNNLNYSEIKLIVDDSINIYAYYFNPTSEKKANIFLVHGAGGNVSKYEPLIRPLLDNGFGVYAFDWRGFGKSTGKPNYKGVMKDTEIAFKDFYSKTLKDSLKTVVYGMSLGGQMAIKITVDNENQVDLLVLDGTVESAQSLAIDHAPIDFLKNKAKNTPEDFNQDYVAVRDISLIEDTPKLIIHSINDVEVPIERGKNVYNAAKNPKEFWETKTEHIMTLKDLSKETSERIYSKIR